MRPTLGAVPTKDSESWNTSLTNSCRQVKFESFYSHAALFNVYSKTLSTNMVNLNLKEPRWLNIIQCNYFSSKNITCKNPFLSKILNILEWIYNLDNSDCFCFVLLFYVVMFLNDCGC